jgi:hypothetical protein
VGRWFLVPKRKPRRQLPAHDHYDPAQFLSELVKLQKSRSDQLQAFVPPEDARRLTVLASASDEQLLRLGTVVAVLKAYEEAPMLSAPVYRGQFIARLQEVERAALTLVQQMEEILNPMDHVTLLVQEALSELLKTLKGREAEDGNLRGVRHTASLLVSTIILAKHFAPSWVSMKRGRPRGAGGSGPAIDRFIERLAFAALNAGGRWTLSKNDARGTFIDALEILRARLPHDFLPSSNKHPYSSYQRVLTRARSNWRNSTQKKRTKKSSSIA